MQVVFILPGGGASGGVRCASIVAKGLLDRGHDVRLLCRRPDGGLGSWIRSLRDKVVYPESADWLSGFSGDMEQYVDIATCRFRAGELIVAFGMASSGLLARLGHVPNRKVQYLHGSTPWCPDLMEQALRLQVPKIIVASYLRDVVASYGGNQVIGVIPNGVDCRQYYSSVPESDRDGVGLIFSWHAAKDPETTLSVIRKLRVRRPDVPIRVFGAHRRPTELKQVSYRRYPTVPQARGIYSRSLVWAVCSKAEGFSMPVLEAMACGCAVVATDCGGTRDIMADGESGFLVPPQDSERIVDKVMQLLDNRDLRERIRNNSQSAVPQFTWERTISELEIAFRRVLA